MTRRLVVLAAALSLASATPVLLADPLTLRDAFAPPHVTGPVETVTRESNGSTVTYHFDADGRLHRIDRSGLDDGYVTDGHSEIHYSDGRVTRLDHFDARGDALFTRHFEWNDRGIFSTHFEPDEPDHPAAEWRVSGRVRDDGDVVMTFRQDSLLTRLRIADQAVRLIEDYDAGFLIRRERFNLDDAGRTTRHIIETIDSDGFPVLNAFSVEYEFDEHGNWVEGVATRRNQTIVVTRQIEYADR